MSCGELWRNKLAESKETTPKEHRAGYVALIGRPNAGKSTLLNRLLGFELSRVNRKPQTTRHRILGILTETNYQIVFLDTPGFLDPRNKLQESMVQTVKRTAAEADIVLILADVTRPIMKTLQFFEKNRLSQPCLLALTKADLIRKDQLLPIIGTAQGTELFSAILPVSALRNEGVDALLNEILRRLPEHPPYFPGDVLTDQPERFFVAEIIRENILRYFSQEIPYAAHVEIEEFKERPGRKDYISAVILVEKKSQKQIVIGKNGAAIKKIGEMSRKEIEQFLGRPVFLNLFVKVMADWRQNERKLKEFGYRQ